MTHECKNAILILSYKLVSLKDLAMDKVARSVVSNDPRMKDDQFPPRLKIETDTYRDNMEEAYVCSRERGCADCQEDFDEVSQSV